MAAGLAVVGLPGVSVLVVDLALGAVLLVVGFLDLVHAVSGRGRSPARSRWRAGLRAPFELAIGIVVLADPRDSVPLFVFLAGAYAVLRGLVVLVRVVLGRGGHRVTRSVTAVALISIGSIALITPESVSAGVVLTLGVGAVLVGVVLLAHGAQVAADPTRDLVDATVASMLQDWVHDVDIGPDRRAALAEGLYFEQPARPGKLGAWWAMLLLSGGIATFAIMQDSTAVVIGAMLVAPLMIPILGLAGALVNGWPRRAAASAWLVAAGAGAVVLLSFLVARWLPPLVALEANSQVTSRVNPTLVDMLIAVLAGAAGAFATVNLRVASSIAGVAIAVALVPPLSVVGITLAAGLERDALGAFLLFVTNVVAIILSSALVFLLGGFADTSLLRDRARRLVLTMAPFGALALAVLVPLVFTSQGLIAASALRGDSEEAARSWLAPQPGLELGQVDVEYRQLQFEVTISVVGSGELPDVEDLHDTIASTVDRPVRLVVDYTPSTRSVVDADGGSGG